MRTMNPVIQNLIDRLREAQTLPPDELLRLVEVCDEPDVAAYLAMQADQVRQGIFGRDVYMRGLIEFTNFCRNDCYYCGIRLSNRGTPRYRLTEDEIAACCAKGYELGFRTFVLQGGEDPHYTDERMVRLIRRLKADFSDCALTLSVGEKPFASYQAYREAGADRYLLRHETANAAHYRLLHPTSLTSAERKRCLYDLKALGFQVGCGFMIGSPGQNREMLTEDLLFMKKLDPQMAGIGPFIPHHETPFAACPAGSIPLTLALLSILRLLLPKLLLSATTALGTLHRTGREQGIMAGANVVMPNLSPPAARTKYNLYDNKLNTGAESAEGVAGLADSLSQIGYRLVVSRGDYPAWED